MRPRERAQRRGAAAKGCKNGGKREGGAPGRHRRRFGFALRAQRRHAPRAVRAQRCQQRVVHGAAGGCASGAARVSRARSLAGAKACSRAARSRGASRAVRSSARRREMARKCNREGAAARSGKGAAQAHGALQRAGAAPCASIIICSRSSTTSRRSAGVPGSSCAAQRRVSIATQRAAVAAAGFGLLPNETHRSHQQQLQPRQQRLPLRVTRRHGGAAARRSPRAPRREEGGRTDDGAGTARQALPPSSCACW